MLKLSRPLKYSISYISSMPLFRWLLRKISSREEIERHRFAGFFPCEHWAPLQSDEFFSDEFLNPNSENSFPILLESYISKRKLNDAYTKIVIHIRLLDHRTGAILSVIAFHGIESKRNGAVSLVPARRLDNASKFFLSPLFCNAQALMSTQYGFVLTNWQRNSSINTKGMGILILEKARRYMAALFQDAVIITPVMPLQISLKRSAVDMVISRPSSIKSILEKSSYGFSKDANSEITALLDRFPSKYVGPFNISKAV